MAVMAAQAPCFTCKTTFLFDPETVPSVPIDPQTGLTPDLGGDPDRAVKRPLCPSCCVFINAKRREKGQTTFLSEANSLDNLRES